MLADPIVLPTTLPSAAELPATIHAALPALTVLLINGAKDFLFAVVILIAGWMISRWVGRWAQGIVERTHYIDNTVKPLVSGIARYFILGVTFVVVLGQFGVQTTSLIAVLGAAGLALGLALQGTLSNVASGVMLLILRPFKVGDYIVVDANVGGTVREISLFTTVLITPDMMYISVPNSRIFSSPITNFTREATRRINIVVGISYSDDIGQAQEILLDIMNSDPRVLKMPIPIAPVDALAESSVNLIARCFVSNKQYWDVYFDFQKAIKLRFDAAGITIPYPQRVMTVREVPAEPTDPLTEQPDGDSVRDTVKKPN